MKNTLWIKFIAILLCALCLFTAAASGLSLGILTYSGWTDDPYDDELERAGRSTGMTFPTKFRTRTERC